MRPARITPAEIVHQSDRCLIILSFIVCCLLFVVCCLLFVVYCLLKTNNPSRTTTNRLRFS
ncbi:MAG TPA: hypothetical protein DCL61_24735 [Cyanobacteria bacterium UBA12227]|nr:hypothetical protein [Cyanobacteria bacterium UBA12227]HAX88012.1 hypothetical protein [Cyanobacteria bacterium UBA11370]